jgi:primosomal protein N' (replication factor Y)
MPLIAQVAVDLPGSGPLDYLAPGDADAPAPAVGQLCVVPLGHRSVVGVVTALKSTTEVPADRLRTVARLVIEIPPLGGDWLELTRFGADYYQQGWGEFAVAALPLGMRTPPGPRFKARLAQMRAQASTSASAAARPPEALNPDQQTALDALGGQRGFGVNVLFGITGSGKTAVYLNLMALHLARQPTAQVLLLVPEINLTPQLESLLQRRFPQAPLAVLHSNVPAARRTAAWLAAHEGRARIVLGTRMAVLASLPHLTCVIVDEEHDPSYKAGDGARYSARDLAIKRAQTARVPVVLGSATPSLETWAQVQAGRYQRLDLPQRATLAAVLPAVSPVDLRADPAKDGLSGALRAALQQTFERREQSLIFINRRGYAPVLSCEACGWLSSCPRCSVFAAFHKTDRTLRCHHCGWQQSVPAACPTCGNPDVQGVGQGTQRIEETLGQLLPGARVARIDRDSTRRQGSAQAAFDAVHAGETDVLVGTQMIAKGHDFRGVTLVGVLNADAQLASHDFRAPERLFATLMQVAGRAGRAGLPSRVLVQTRLPSHPLLAALARHDYAAFADQQLAERRTVGLPPFTAQALLLAEARTLEAALDWLTQARERCPAGAARIYAPVPMPLARLADWCRAQLLIEADTRGGLQAALRAWLPAVRELAAQRRPRIRWQIEVDPQQI